MEVKRFDLIYPAFLRLRASGGLNWEADTIKAMLLGGGYTPDRKHASRSDVVALEIPASGGYITGGLDVTGRKVAVVKSELRYYADRLLWRSSSIRAAYCVLYRARGMLPEDDNLIRLLDLRADDGGERASFNHDFEVEFDARGVMCDLTA